MRKLQQDRESTEELIVLDFPVIGPFENHETLIVKMPRVSADMDDTESMFRQLSAIWMAATARRRSKAIESALKREPRRAASRKALARQARSAARKRTRTERSAAARRAARTKGRRGRSAAARKAARTRARRR